MKLVATESCPVDKVFMLSAGRDDIVRLSDALNQEDIEEALAAFARSLINRGRLAVLTNVGVQRDDQ